MTVSWLMLNRDRQVEVVVLSVCSTVFVYAVAVYWYFSCTPLPRWGCSSLLFKTYDRCKWIILSLLLRVKNDAVAVIAQELENERKERAQVTCARRKQLAKLRLKAEKTADEKLGSQLDILAPLKYWECFDYSYMGKHRTFLLTVQCLDRSIYALVKYVFFRLEPD